MERAWEGDTPHSRFWRRLLNENVDQLINDPEKSLLKHMRHNHEMVKTYQRKFGVIFVERGLCLYKLIAEACGETWDEEDEEKQRYAATHENVVPMSIKNAVCLDNSRQVGLRENQGEGGDLSRCNGSGEKDLQEGLSSVSCKGGLSLSEEETPG